MMNLLILQLSGIVTDTTVHYTANTYGTVVVHALMLTFYMFSFDGSRRNFEDMEWPYFY